jgi:serine/threonine protein kinase
MPWVEGESLRARLDARGALPVSEAVAIIADVAKALSYAHAHGVVLRDIKPENVLLSGHTAVVTDFGIAKAITLSQNLAPFETLTQVGTSLGTPAYMAPSRRSASCRRCGSPIGLSPATQHSLPHCSARRRGRWSCRRRRSRRGCRSMFGGDCTRSRI